MFVKRVLSYVTVLLVSPLQIAIHEYQLAYVCAYTVYQVIFVGGNFREKLDKVPRNKFRGFKFRATMGGNMNFNF